MKTLYGYILLELIKVTLLAELALTGLLTLCGGLFNMVRYEGVTPADVLSLMPFLIPVVVTFTLPIAVLFAATMVYGRLAADNELLACRAAGINVHRLFRPALAMGLFVALFSLLFSNVVAPRLANVITSRMQANVRDIIAEHLQREGFVYYHDRQRGHEFTITAEDLISATPEAYERAGYEVGPGLEYLCVVNPTYLQRDAAGALVRFTVAEYGVVQFDTRSGKLEVRLDGIEARDFQIGQHAIALGQQTIGPLPVPMAARQVILNASTLTDLVNWYHRPWELPRFADRIDEFLTMIKLRYFAEALAQQLAAGQPAELVDRAGRRYRISGAGHTLDGRGLTIKDGQVEVFSADQTLPQRYEAAKIEVRATPTPSELVIHLNLMRTADKDVLEYEPDGAGYGAPRRKPTTSLDGLLIPPTLLTSMAKYDRAALLDAATTLPDDARLRERRESLQHDAQDWRRKIVATINTRFAYTSSSLVTVLLGAVLGVIFRGARALAAFAISVIPLFSLIILIVLGRQIGEEPATAAWGPAVTYGGLVLVYLSGVLVQRLGVAR